MLPGALPRGSQTPPPQALALGGGHGHQWLPLGSLSTRRELSAPHPHRDKVAGGGRAGAETHPCWGAPGARTQPTLSSLANTQMRESRRLQHPKVCVRLLHASSSLALHPPRRLRRGGLGAGRLGRWVQGSAVWRAWAGNTKLKSSSRAQCPCRGARVLPASRLRRRTSYQSGGCAGRGSWRRPCPESA